MSNKQELPDLSLGELARIPTKERCEYFLRKVEGEANFEKFIHSYFAALDVRDLDNKSDGFQSDIAGLQRRLDAVEEKSENTRVLSEKLLKDGSVASGQLEGINSIVENNKLKVSQYSLKIASLENQVRNNEKKIDENGKKADALADLSTTIDSLTDGFGFFLPYIKSRLVVWFVSIWLFFSMGEFFIRVFLFLNELSPL